MKNRTTFEKFPRTNAGRSKNWKTLRALCLLLFLSVSFTAYSQITVNVKDISLRASLKKIEQVSNYKFFYNENLPELNQKVSLNVQNTTIQQVMKQLLGKMELTYKQEQENIIVLIRKEQEKKRNINVSGTVVDEKGEPVIGASVTVVGTALGTITNLEGKYSLTDVQEDSKVAISFVGYGALTFSAKDKQLARVVLKEDSELLDEVVVIGYGTERKSDLSTAVSQVKSKDFESISYSDPGQAIAGRMPGIYVKQASGAPGGNPQISIRGTGTISSGSSPLVVVDGLPVTDDVGLNSINPNDIESINVLKDVASAAIYGSRAANGVILITTKKGKAGKAQYTFNTYYGVQQVEKKYDLVDAYQQAELMAEAFQYKNQEIPFTGSENWQEVVIDLEEYIGSTFKQFYFSPNEKFGTDNVAVAETTYLDNIYISDVATSSGIADNVVSTSKVWGGKGALYVEGEAGEMSVYSVSGMEIGKYALNGFLQIDIERGIYLVKIGDTTSKIVVY